MYTYIFGHEQMIVEVSKGLIKDSYRFNQLNIFNF